VGEFHHQRGADERVLVDVVGEQGCEHNQERTEALASGADGVLGGFCHEARVRLRRLRELLLDVVEQAGDPL